MKVILTLQSVEEINTDVNITTSEVIANFYMTNYYKGDKGNPGVGVPIGGTTSQVLKKKSNDDYDTEWADEQGGAYRDWETDRKSTRLNSSHRSLSRMPSSA